MKKTISVLIALVLALSLTACGAPPLSGGSTPAEADPSSAQGPRAPEKKKAMKLPVFSREATLEETVLYDQDGIRITATGLEYSNWQAEVSLLFENNSGKDLEFVSGSLGYSCNAVNDCMIPDGYVNCSVENGNQATDSLGFEIEMLQFFGIQEIAELELGFSICDDDYNHIYTGPLSMQTSAYGVDREEGSFPETLEDEGLQALLEYSVSGIYRDFTYDCNDLAVLSGGFLEKDGRELAFLEVRNSGDKPIQVLTANIALNGVVVESGHYSGTSVNPGKRAILDMPLTNMLEENVRQACGLQKIQNVSLWIGQQDAYGADLTTPEAVVIGKQDLKSGKLPGREIYSLDGVTLHFVDLLEQEKGGFRMVMMAENQTDGRISLDDQMDSFSANGTGLDYFMPGAVLMEGDRAVLTLEVGKNELMTSGLALVSAIDEMELALDIEKDGDVFDAPVITITR